MDKNRKNIQKIKRKDKERNWKRKNYKESQYKKKIKDP